MKLFNAIKKLREKFFKKQKVTVTLSYHPIIMHSETVKYKDNMDLNITRLKTIYLHTKKFRVKKKLNKRISKLENCKLIQIREM